MSQIQFDQSSLSKEAKQMREALEVLEQYNAGTLQKMATQLGQNRSDYCKELSNTLENLKDTTNGQLIKAAEYIASAAEESKRASARQDEAITAALEKAGG